MKAQKVRKIKLLWRGAFNFHSVARVMYAFAFTERQAWLVFCRRMAEKDDVPPSAVMALFDGMRDNFIIEEEKK